MDLTKVHIGPEELLVVLNWSCDEEGKCQPTCSACQEVSAAWHTNKTTGLRHKIQIWYACRVMGKPAEPGMICPVYRIGLALGLLEEKTDTG